MITKPVKFEAFAGRVAELSFLRERISEAARGNGSVVAILGDAGLGKTRLVQELRMHADGDAFCFAIGNCLEYAHNALGPFLDILKFTNGGSTVFSLLSAEDDALEPAVRKLRVFDTILERLRCFSRENAPFVLIIEDVHWADDASLQMLEHLARNIRLLPVCAIVTCRTDAVNEDKRVGAMLSKLQRHGAHAAYLEPLTRGEVRFLMNSVLQQNPSLPRATAERVEDVAAGNPLYLEELLREAIDRATNGEPAEGRIPHTLKAAVLERLERLPSRIREITIKAAVLVDDFDVSLLTAVSRRSEIEVVEALQQAVDANFLRETGSEGRYRFRHVLIREVLYSQLTAASAVVLHARAAEALERQPGGPNWLAERAYHWSAASNAPMAVRYNEAAGNSAMALHTYRDAARFFRRALEFAPHSLARRATLEERLARALYCDGSLHEAKPHFKNAIDGYIEVGSLGDAARVSGGLYTVYWNDGDTEGALNFASSIVQFVENGVNRDISDAILIRTAGFFNLLGMNDEVDKLLRHVGSDPDMDFESQIVLRTLRAISSAIKGNFSEAVDEFESALRLSQASNAYEITAQVAMNFSICHQLAGDFEKAERLAKVASACVEEHKTGLTDQCILALHHANVLFLRGRIDEATRVIERALAYGAGFGQMRIHVARIGIPIALATMRDDILSRCSDESVIELAFATRCPDDIAMLADAFVRFYVRQGRLDDALVLLRRAMEKANRSPFALDLFVTAAKHGSLADAPRAQEDLSSLCSRRPELVGRAYGAYFDAIMAGRLRNWADRKRFAKIAIAGFAELGLPIHQAEALELVGRQMDALSIYRKVGAEAEAIRLERLFADRGHRGGALTRRQFQIAVLIAARKSNREIALQIGVSEKTLESHLTSIHRRLGIESRGALTAYLAEHFA